MGDRAMQRTSPETERLKAWRKTKSAVHAYAMQPSAANADMVESAFRKVRRLTPRTASPLGRTIGRAIKRPR